MEAIENKKIEHKIHLADGGCGRGQGYRIKGVNARNTYSAPSFVIEAFKGRPICTHCRRRIQQDPNLLNDAEEYVKEGIYGMVLLKIQTTNI